MAPALTKFKDGHGIHLSSPPALDSPLQSSEDLQKTVFSVLPSLDSYFQPAPILPNVSDMCLLADSDQDSYFHHSPSSTNDAESEQQFCLSESSPHFTEIKEFGQCSLAVLRALQEELDSEATASSSSDDETVETKTAAPDRHLSVASPLCEEQWLTERAELSSRWTWLQLRVSELEGRIQKLTELHDNICSAKGCVMLADSAAITRRQKLREMQTLSRTTPDADNEACSPTRLLHNIERQSAQLSQIVNSLLLPLNLSPISDKKFNRDFLVSGNAKRRKLSVKARQLFRDDMSCICARTRPLVSYHKPRLFRLTPMCNNNSSKIPSPRSGLALCSCSSCSSSCNPLLTSSDMDSSTLSVRMCHSNHGDSSVSSHFIKGFSREEWSQTPLVLNALPFSPLYDRRRCSTPLSSHKYTRYRQNYNKRVLRMSSIKLDCVQRKHRRFHERKRSRRRRHRLTEDKYDYFSSDDLFERGHGIVSPKHSTKRAVHRRHGKRVFNIDNVVIPASLAKVEKLQYKDILTPRWEVIDSTALIKDNADSEEDPQTEIITDEIFAQRHLPLERKEKQRWTLKGKRRCRNFSRSGGRISSCSVVLEEISVECFTHPDPDEQLSTEECLPQASWERRVFPLNEADEQSLSSEVPDCCGARSLSSSTSLNSDLIEPQSSDTTPPSSGHYMNYTISTDVEH
uniref:PEHE domain-containing protein n=1 Tax=Knipowitschia caucasica TaxID=637954 RepID=A0AAV2K455_KNICA